MKTVEALWTVKFGTAEYEFNDLEGGVLILETQRVYGGDSVYAYRGDFTIDDQTVVGRLTMHRHNWAEGTQSLYGDQEPAFAARFEGKRRGDDLVVGTLLREGFPDGFFSLTRLHDLD